MTDVKTLLKTLPFEKAIQDLTAGQFDLLIPPREADEEGIRYLVPQAPELRFAEVSNFELGRFVMTLLKEHREQAEQIEQLKAKLDQVVRVAQG